MSIPIDCADPRRLADFWADVLGWEVTVAGPEWAEVPNPDGGIGLSFHIESIYEPPVWPAEPGQQQMQVHLEIAVDDLDTACAHAQSLGATQAAFQPQEGVRVHLDPVGHPFCLYVPD